MYTSNLKKDLAKRYRLITLSEIALAGLVAWCAWMFLQLQALAHIPVVVTILK